MFKAGETLILEHGAYSSYEYTGPFRVLHDFSPADAFDKFRAQNPDNTDCSAFIAWLAREEYIVDLPASTWFLGEYGLDAGEMYGSGPDGERIETRSQAQIEEAAVRQAALEEENVRRHVEWLKANPGAYATTSFSTTIKA